MSYKINRNLILADILFKYVTIKEDGEKDKYGQRFLGHIRFGKTKSEMKWDQFSVMNPKEFNMYFKDDFTKLAGLVAEMIYRGRFNYKAAKGDFSQWVGTSLNQLPESLNSKYISFLLEYTFQVLHEKNNWSNIIAVAFALVEEETLSYKRVCEVIEHNKINPVLK